MTNNIQLKVGRLHEFKVCVSSLPTDYLLYVDDEYRENKLKSQGTMRVYLGVYKEVTEDLGIEWITI